MIEKIVFVRTKIGYLTVQLFTNTQNFLHVASHYLVDFIQLIIQLSNIPLGARVLVQFFCFLYKSILRT